MKIKTLTPLFDMRGQSLKSPPPSDGAMTFRDAVSAALGAIDSKILSPYKQLGLAAKIQSAEEVDLDAEDRKAVEACMAQAYAPLISGQVAAILQDGKSMFAPAEATP